MTPSAYALLGVTAFVAVLVAVVAFAILRFAAAARDTRRHLRGGADSAILTAALQDAVEKLKAQEQATSARAVASERLSRQIVDSLTAGLLVVERTGRTEILNPAGRRMLGVHDDGIGRDYRDVLADAPSLVSVVDECLTIPRPIARRTVEIDVAGRACRFGVTVSPLGGEGVAGGVICLFSDLTAVMELEQQLRLKDTFAQLGELTAGIAHEFRNGLATIHGYSRLMDPQELPAAYRPYLAGMRDETALLGHIVTNFLNFARPEQVVLVPVELGTIASRAGDDLLRELPAGTTVGLTGEFGDVLGDEVLLRQMFVNLVRNAAEACEGAGIVPAIAIAGRLDRPQKTCLVSIGDNGPGIPAPERERVFRPFFTTRSRGTGLGLAIVQKVVVIHNGRIAIGTSAAGGASVDLTFPLAPQAFGFPRSA